MNTCEALALQNVGEFSEVSLSLPGDLPESEWLEVGKKLVPMAQSAAWWVGDWLNFGIEQYGKHQAYRLFREVAPNKLGDSTLYMYRRVAERFKTCNRIVGLSWSHHQAVETLEEKDQQLVLQEALANSYTVDQVRAMAESLQSTPPANRKKKPHPDVPTSGPTVSTGVLLYPEDKDFIDALAMARSGTAKNRREIIGEIVHGWIAANRAELESEIARKQEEKAHATMETATPLFA